MERLTIDEIIEHCERKTNIYEKSVGIDYLETTSMSNSIKEYWEHKQVAEYLKELKLYRLAIKQCKESSYMVNSKEFAKHMEEWVKEQLKAGGTDE